MLLLRTGTPLLCIHDKTHALPVLLFLGTQRQVLVKTAARSPVLTSPSLLTNTTMGNHAGPYPRDVIFFCALRCSFSRSRSRYFFWPLASRAASSASRLAFLARSRS